MTVELFTLCDFASNDNGHLTIINTLDKIVADKLPWRAYFGFAISGTIKHEQPNNTILTLSIFKKRKKDSIIFETSTQIDSKIGKFAAAGNLRGLIFNKEGEYIFRIATNNGLRKDFPFNVTTSQKQ